MGLAASQARFLGITARKNSCELKSMQIAQEKLSITNQLSRISEDYQRSLDATKLVWDSEAADGAIYDVTYDLLMHPSALNDYSPQLITNLKNQIVLDSRYANAIREMGDVGTKIVKKENGTSETQPADMQYFSTGGTPRTEENFKKFLNCLQSQGILSNLDLTRMTEALETQRNPENISLLYKPNNGLGGDVQSKFVIDSMNLATMKNYINTITNSNSEYMNNLHAAHGVNTSGDPKEDTIYDKVKDIADKLNFRLSSPTSITTKTGDTINNPKFSEYVANKGGYNSTQKKFNINDDTLKITDGDFNLAELLTKDITMSTNDANNMGNLLSTFIESMYDIMKNFFAINENSVDENYLNFAMDQICRINNMKWNSATAQAEDFNSSNVLTSGESASKHTSVIKNGDNYQVSLSNVAKGLITFFEVAVEGFDSGYSVETNDKKLTSNSYYITADAGYFYFIDNPEAMDEDTNTLLLLDYYSQMFNQICANGWTENSMVDEPEKLKNMLKNGTLFTTTIADDGNFYQGPYTSNNYIAEVADEDAIVRAEAEFKIKQAKLTAKEERLNIDMQMVDAELSALTTEYDTVKQMISKGVEKGFSTLGG